MNQVHCHQYPIYNVRILDRWVPNQYNTHLPRQLHHPEIPRAETLVGVDRPVACVVTLALSATVTWMWMFVPPQLKVLVHQLCQAAPVSVLQSRPEGGTFSVRATLKETHKAKFDHYCVKAFRHCPLHIVHYCSYQFWIRNTLINIKHTPCLIRELCKSFHGLNNYKLLCGKTNIKADLIPTTKEGEAEVCLIRAVETWLNNMVASIKGTHSLWYKGRMVN